MSFNINASSNTSPLLQSALNSLNSSGTITTISTNGSSTISPFNSKIFPTFKMELFKSENGGFVLNLIICKDNSYTESSKLFILNDVENLGRDIQNILLVEILKK